MKELVIMAPTQVKDLLSPGNIYDWTIIDFYCKARKMQGIEVYCPLLWNVNGNPVLKQVMQNRGKIDQKSIKSYVETTTKKLKQSFSKYSISFDAEVRDDQIQKLLNEYIVVNFRGIIQEDVIKIAKCVKCDSFYGTDPKIKICKTCFGKITFSPQRTLFININKKKIDKLIGKIAFFPESTRQKLISFNNKMPQEYKLIITRKRLYTLKYRKFQLDPRFIAIILPSICTKKEYDEITYIHGDVIKKLDYYTLCYLGKGDPPTRIVSHGNLMDGSNKKLRWQENISGRNFFEGIDPSLLRMHFLKQNIFSGLRMNKEHLANSVRGLYKLRHRINLLLKTPINNANLTPYPVNEDFMSAINNFRYAIAFEIMQKNMKTLWKKTKDRQLTKSEFAWIKTVNSLYYT